MGLENRQYYRDEQPVYGRSSGGASYGTWSIVNIIIAINVIIFLLDAFSPSEGGKGQLRLLNSLLAMDSQQLWMFWTPLTHGFAHASLGSDIGFWHLAGNMITLFFLGRPVEQRLGREEFLKFYIAAILVSGITFLVIHILTGQRRLANAVQAV